MSRTGAVAVQANDMAVRQASPNDSPCLCRLDHLVNGDAGRTATRFQVLCGNVDEGGKTSSGECALVLQLRGDIVAFALYSRVLDEATLHSIAVDPALQGRGLGRHLLAAMLARAAGAGARRCLLEVRAGNTVARALYEKLGFSLDGVRKDYYPACHGREDALLMSVLL